VLGRFPSKRAASNAAEGLRQQLGEKRSDVVPTVNALIEAYLAEKAPERYSTRRPYDAWLRLYINPRWGDSPITELQARPVETWLQSLPLKGRSKSSIRFLVSALWDFAMWRGDIATQRNPMELVRIKGASTRTREPRSMTIEEGHSLLQRLEEPFRTIGTVQLCFGLRISELLGLKWSDIDWLRAELRIQRSIVRQRVGDTKTAGSRKPMKIADEMLELLKVWKQQSKFSGGDDWVFASPVQLGRLPWSADAVGRAYQKAATAAGIGHVGTHALRHTYRSWLDAIGTPITVQQRLMRHSDIRTTMNVYGDVVTSEAADAQGKIAALALYGNSTQTARKPS